MVVVEAKVSLGLGRGEESGEVNLLRIMLRTLTALVCCRSMVSRAATHQHPTHIIA